MADESLDLNGGLEADFADEVRRAMGLKPEESINDEVCRQYLIREMGLSGNPTLEEIFAAQDGEFEGLASKLRRSGYVNDGTRKSAKSD